MQAGTRCCKILTQGLGCLPEHKIIKGSILPLLITPEEAFEICKECGAACCKTGGPDFTEAEMKRVLDAGHPDHFRKIGEDQYELASVEGVCPYLSGSMCSIHPVRNNRCRSWPVDVDFEGDAQKFSLIGCKLAEVMSAEDIRQGRELAMTIPKTICSSLANSKLSPKDIAIICERLDKFPKKAIS